MAEHIQHQSIDGSKFSGDAVSQYLQQQEVLNMAQKQINGQAGGQRIGANEISVASFNGPGGKAATQQSAAGNKLLVDLHQQAAYDKDINQWGGMRKGVKKRVRRRNRHRTLSKRRRRGRKRTRRARRRVRKKCRTLNRKYLAGRSSTYIKKARRWVKQSWVRKQLRTLKKKVRGRKKRRF